MDWSEVRADDLELPEDDDLGIHTCVHALPAEARCCLPSVQRACQPGFGGLCHHRVPHTC